MISLLILPIWEYALILLFATLLHSLGTAQGPDKCILVPLKESIHFVLSIYLPLSPPLANLPLARRGFKSPPLPI